MKEREWLAVMLMIALLAVMTIKSIKNEQSVWPHHFGQEVAVPHKVLTVNIRGAVKNPGRYHMTEGAKVKDLIEAAVPEEGADFTRIDENGLLKKGQRVYVPQRKAHQKVR